MEIIPAIDIIDGKCVRLAKGDFEKKIIYNDNPSEVAKSFEDGGIKRLHIVDLDGANGQPLKNIRALENIANSTSLTIDFGGGVKKTEHVKSVFDAGASMISVGSIIVKEPELLLKWLRHFGTGKFLPGADVLHQEIKINGWKDKTAIDVFDFVGNLISMQVSQIFCTDISKDGMMMGPATELYTQILKRFPKLHLIASGGISCFDDLIMLRDAGCKGAIVGKAIYEGKITMKQIENFNQ